MAEPERPKIYRPMNAGELHQLPLPQPELLGRVVHLPTAPLVKEDGTINRELLFDRYSKLVYGLLIRLLGPGPDLEDLVQEVFVELLASLPRLEDNERISGFVKSVAVNTARATIRKRQRLRWFTQAEPLLARWEHSCEQGDFDLKSATRQALGLIEKLPTDERIAFSLRYLEGLELVDVAEVCGVSLSTVKRRIHRARELFVARAQRFPELRQWLEENEQ